MFVWPYYMQTCEHTRHKTLRVIFQVLFLLWFVCIGETALVLKTVKSDWIEFSWGIYLVRLFILSILSIRCTIMVVLEADCQRWFGVSIEVLGVCGMVLHSWGDDLCGCYSEKVLVVFSWYIVLVVLNLYTSGSKNSGGCTSVGEAQQWWW